MGEKEKADRPTGVIPAAVIPPPATGMSQLLRKLAEEGLGSRSGARVA